MMTQELIGTKQQASGRSMPSLLLHLEGAVIFIVATAVYFRLDNTWWVFPLLLLAPDLAAIAYVGGPRVGSIVYNLAHTIVGPVLLGVGGWWLGAEVAGQLALIWLAHIGMDRAVGYGLKYPDAFKHTHMNVI